MFCNAPGPDKQIDMEEFARGKALAVRYRNRRIGEFLQEIQLSEKKSTGITKVLNALESNGSPPPSFETDKEREAFFATVYLHEGFAPIVGNETSILFTAPDDAIDWTMVEKPSIAGDKPLTTTDNRR
jgi:ATP-dependent DNA helicase RecG